MKRASFTGFALLILLAGCDHFSASLGSESWVAVAPGDSHTCARTDAASVFCWGVNIEGELGTPTTAQYNQRPLQLLLGPLGVNAVSSGVVMSCALLSDHRALCWGDSVTTPVFVARGARFRQVSVGARGCGLTFDGAIWCWTGPAAAAIEVPGDFGAGEVAVGYTSACALVPQGGIRCWSFATPTPAQVPGTSGLTYHGLTMGDFHGCALDEDDIARCWGSNTLGQLGDSTYTNRTSPTPVIQGDRSAGDLFTTLHAYGGKTCGVTESHGGYCWGQGSQHPTATAVIQHWTALVPGLGHICGFAESDGALYCYGANDWGQIGDGTRNYANAPTKVLDP